MAWRTVGGGDRGAAMTVGSARVDVLAHRVACPAIAHDRDLLAEVLVVCAALLPAPPQVAGVLLDHRGAFPVPLRASDSSGMVAGEAPDGVVGQLASNESVSSLLHRQVLRPGLMHWATRDLPAAADRDVVSLRCGSVNVCAGKGNVISVLVQRCVDLLINLLQLFVHFPNMGARAATL